MDYSRILKKSLPSKSDTERIRRKVSKMMDSIGSRVKKRGIKARVELGGSLAKGTFLDGDFDCDIFVCFDYSYKEDDISRSLWGAISSLGFKRVHGSRDYFQKSIEGIVYEVVPVLDVSSPELALNVTDCSPLHVKWIRKRIRSRKLRDGIILAKLFCKSAGVYGAESYIKGFSGHVIDILVTYYGSFDGLVKAASKWKPQVLIDVEKHRAVLNKSKTQGPLVVVDPIQPERNAAAAMGMDKFKDFVKVSKKFLKNPNENFFIRKEESAISVRKRYPGAIMLEAVPVQGKEDIVGCKLLKVYETILRLLEPFGVKKSGWFWSNRAVFWFVLENPVLEPVFERQGPALEMEEHVKAFKKQHKVVFTRSGRVFARMKRKDLSAESALRNAMDSLFGNRVKQICFK